MLLVLLPAVLGSLVTVVLLWPDGEEPEATLLPGTTVLEQETGVVRATTAEVCAGAPEDRLPDGTIPDSALCAVATVEIVTGPDAGAVVDVALAPQVWRAGVAEDIRVTLGRIPGADAGITEAPTDQVTAADVAPSGDVYVFEDFERRLPLAVLAGVFAVLVVLVGRLRGLGALVGLVLAYAMIAFFVLPALREGSDAVAVALSSAVLIMTVLLYLAHGFSARTTAALLGTVLGVAMAAGLAVWASGAARLTGLTDEETFTLSSLTGGSDLSGIILAGIIIAGLGVLNDVTITQVSAVWEVHDAAPGQSFGRLFRSGMRIGRDHLASTVYTIAFAYAGAALPTLLLIDLYGRPLDQVLVSAPIAEEIVSTAVGSIGLILAIPVTTAIAAAVVASSGRIGTPSTEIDGDGPRRTGRRALTA
jgi:uncharacterized membrane protein